MTVVYGRAVHTSAQLKQSSASFARLRNSPRIYAPPAHTTSPQHSGASQTVALRVHATVTQNALSRAAADN